MRRVTTLTLALMLTLAGGTSAQDQAQGEPRNEAVYQGLWCLYLHAHPYVLNAPADVTCAYEPRPMTIEEAGAFYQRLAQDANYLGYQWQCADGKSKGGLSWKQDKRWAMRDLRVSKVGHRQVRAVLWPEDVRKKIAKYLDLSAVEDLAKKRVYTSKSLLAAFSSGHFAAYSKANGKRADLSQQLRKALNIPDVPDPGNDCKAAKRYEAMQKQNAVQFDNPFDHPDLMRVATLLAGSGLIETQLNAVGEPSMFLTDQGLTTARSMPAIGEQATSEEVVAGLFAPVEPAGPEPSPSPSSEPVELTLPEG